MTRTARGVADGPPNASSRVAMQKQMFLAATLALSLFLLNLSL
jgi:hypothetical protein